MLLAALRTAAAAVLVSLWVFVAGPPVLLWTMLTGRPALLYATAAFGVRMGFALAGIAIRLAGVENLQPGPAVYACNHSSNVDSPAVFYALRRLFPRVRVLYKAELRKLPVLVWAFDAAGFVPIERGNRDQSWAAMDRAADALRQGNAFFIFPEGTRSRTGELLPFKKGGFVMALKAQAPIVPGRRLRRPRGDAQGESADLACDGDGDVSFRPFRRQGSHTGIATQSSHGCERRWNWHWVRQVRRVRQVQGT